MPPSEGEAANTSDADRSQDRPMQTAYFTVASPQKTSRKDAKTHRPSLVWSAAVLCSAALVSLLVWRRVTKQPKQAKPKRQSKALPHSKPKQSLRLGAFA